MPKDNKKHYYDDENLDNIENTASSGNSSPNDNKEKTSSGKGLPDDSLLRKSESNRGGFKETLKNALNGGNNYKANKNFDKKNNSDNGNLKSGDNKSAGNKVGNFVKNKTMNALSAIPGVGQVIKGAQLAKNTLDKIKERRNNPNSDGSKVGKGPVSDKENINKEGAKDSLGKKDNNKEKSKETDNFDLSSDSNPSVIKGRMTKQVMYIGVCVIVGIVVISFLFLSGDEISSNRLNFYASTIRDEELVKGLNLNCDSIADNDEKRLCKDLETIYKGNKQFSPELLTSTLQVMMTREQYSNDGSFDYSDISLSMMKDLAEKIKGSEVECTASSKTNVSTSGGGTTEVAGDAATMVGSGHGLGADYVPNVIDTGRVGVDSEVCKVTQETYDAFKKMEAGAAAQGVTIGVNSCYRSYEEQAVTTGNSPASPGYSEHQLGSTIDIANRDNGYITDENVLIWLNAHAAEYGFVRSLTTMGNERHHYRYVGTKVASAFVDYINNGGVNYLTFQSTDAFQSVVGSTNNNSTANSNTSSSTNTNISSLNTTSQAQKVLEIAQREFSLTDGTNMEDASGVTKYGTWYGMPTAEWCAIFVSWVAHEAGVTEDVIPKAALVSAMRSVFEQQGTFHPTSDGSYQAKPGDIIFYEHGHVGIVVSNDNGHLVTIEGNSTRTEDRIARKEGVIGDDTFYDVAGFGSPNYSGEAVSNDTSTGNVENTDEKYREPIKNFVKQYLPKLTDERADRLVDEIFEFKNDYYELIGKKCEANCSTSSGGSGNCDYNIKGFYYSGSNHDQQLSISNLKVRLMSCSANPTPLSNELIDFEKYIMGVVYAEIGSGAPVEAMKAQAIAARSYALSRPAAMNNSGGTLLTQEDGQWILQLRGCTLDQVYCDPDAGCSNEVIKGPLDQNDLLRSAVEETKGKLLVNNEGYVINTEFRSTDQNDWSDMASGENPMDYTEILIQHYNNSRPYGASKIESMSCGETGSSTNPECVEQNAANTASGPYATWLQTDPRWGSISVGGGSSIAQIGCLATSISMLVARSGVPTIIQGEFNPGTFVQAMNSNGGFVNGGDLVWDAVRNVAPTFQYAGREAVSDSNAVSRANELLSQGYYIVAQVTGYGSGQHWVAIDKVENGRLLMMDPASNETDLLSHYPDGMLTTFAYYKVG